MGRGVEILGRKTYAANIKRHCLRSRILTWRRPVSLSGQDGAREFLACAELYSIIWPHAQFPTQHGDCSLSHVTSQIPAVGYLWSMINGASARAEQKTSHLDSAVTPPGPATSPVTKIHPVGASVPRTRPRANIYLHLAMTNLKRKTVSARNT